MNLLLSDVELISHRHTFYVEDGLDGDPREALLHELAHWFVMTGKSPRGKNLSTKIQEYYGREQRPEPWSEIGEIKALAVEVLVAPRVGVEVDFDRLILGAMENMDSPALSIRCENLVRRFRKRPRIIAIANRMYAYLERNCSMTDAEAAVQAAITCVRNGCKQSDISALHLLVDKCANQSTHDGSMTGELYVLLLQVHAGAQQCRRALENLKRNHASTLLRIMKDKS